MMVLTFLSVVCMLGIRRVADLDGQAAGVPVVKTESRRSSDVITINTGTI